MNNYIRRLKVLRTILTLGFVCLIFMGITGCDQNEKAKVISLEKRDVVEEKVSPPEEKPLKFAVGGMVTPREGLAYYRNLLDYIGEKLGKKIEFVDREGYFEINNLLKTNYIDVAFVCAGPYVDGHNEFGMELLAAPKAYGGTVYYSYIIVSKDSIINSFEGLRGKVFDFADPLSNTGKLVPTYMLAKMNETPESFFKRFDFTYAHDKSIKAVATGIVDGAAVNSLVWEYANQVNPEFTSRTKIIEKSPAYGIPPVVVHPALDPELKEKLRQIFLNIHKDEKGRKILKGMLIDKFVLIDDSAYDSVREMRAWMSKEKENKQ